MALNAPVILSESPPSAGRSYLQSRGDLFFVADNAWDIGASGANRPRYIYAGANIFAFAAVLGTSANGSNEGLYIVSGGATNPRIRAWGTDLLLDAASTTAGIRFAGSFYAQADNTYDIGLNGSNRPRNLYLAADAYAGSFRAANSMGLAVNASTFYCDGWIAPNGNVMEQRNGGSGQQLRIYNTYTDANNYERLSLRWIAGQAIIRTENAGTGIPDNLQLIAAGTLYLGTSGSLQWFVDSGGFKAYTDNTYDIGANGSNRPRFIWAGSRVFAPMFNLNGGGQISDGGGTSSIYFSTVGTDRWIIHGPTGNILAISDNAYDIGQSGANRPRNIYLAQGLYIADGSITKAPGGAFSIVGGVNLNGFGAINLGPILFNGDSAYDIGTSGANRPRNIYVGGAFIGNGAIPVDGAANYALTKVTSNDYDVAWTPVATPSDIASLQSQVSQLSAQVSNQLAQIQTLQTQMQQANDTLADHEARIKVLEGEAAVSDPYIGAVVHVRDENGECQPAIVYEDWKALNKKDVVSAVVVGPVRLSISEWDSKIEVEKENGHIGTPFNFWHWPERYYNQRQLVNR